MIVYEWQTSTSEGGISARLIVWYQEIGIGKREIHRAQPPGANRYGSRVLHCILMLSNT